MAAGNQATLLNTVTLSQFTDLVVKDFVESQKMVEPVAQQVYIYDDMAAHTGDTKRYDEVDTETFGSVKREGMDATKARVGVGYNVTMTAKRIAKEIDITWEMRRYNRKPQVIGSLTSLKHFCPQRIELDLTHRLTFCSSTSYTDMDGDSVSITGGDGLAVVSTSHTLAFSSTTWSNNVSGNPAFSKAGLEAAELLTNTDILSNFAERRVLNFNTIITGDNPATTNDVKQFLNSIADVDSNNSGVTNVYKGKYRHLVLPYLATTAVGANDSTKKRWWFLAALGQGVLGFQAYYGVWEAPHLNTPPAEGNNGEDPHNDNWTYGVRAAYGICIVSGRGLVASLPTS